MGELRKDVDIEQNVRAISGAISGICIQALVTGDTKKLGEDADFVADLFIDRMTDGGARPLAPGSVRTKAGVKTKAAPRRASR
jgi:hypothetical protein